MVWQRLARRRKRKRALAETGRRLYQAIVVQARRPDFYGPDGVPDTPEGRFDLIVLHAVLVIHALGPDDAAGGALAQALFDTMFDDMDYSLREMGVGDLSVGKRVKAMAKGFYGRAAAYEEALAEPHSGALAEALRRNLLAGRDDGDRAEIFADYARRTLDHLQRTPREMLLSGDLVFPPPDDRTMDAEQRNDR